MEVINLALNKNAITFKWVYKMKLKANGSLTTLKVRLLIRGFAQQYVFDHREVFPPLVKMAAIRTVIPLAAAKNWAI